MTIFVIYIFIFNCSIFRSLITHIILNMLANPIYILDYILDMKFRTNLTLAVKRPLVIDLLRLFIMYVL